MTALAAVFGGGGHGSADAVARMLAPAAHRGSQRPVSWIAPRAVLGCRASPRASDPPLATSPDGSAAILDGRIDNLDDLRRELSLEPGAPAAAVTLAAYGRWQAQAASRLLGDFAFVVWDAPRDRLVAARDALGQRPLFYASAAGLAIVASEPEQILAHPAVPSGVNDGMIAEFLTGRPVTVEETVWAAIRRVRPAHALFASDGQLACTRYWDFDLERQLAYARDEEYDEQFRGLFAEAIACRLRGARAAGVFLSGGVDSSAIVAAAQTLADAAPLRAYSLTFPGLPVDEAPYIDAVVQAYDLPSVRLRARAPARAEIESDIDRHRDLPSYPNGAILNPLRERAAAEVEVILTGYGGDDFFTGSPLHSADLLRRGRFVAAAAQIAHDARLPGRGYSAASLLRAAVSPLLGPRTRSVLRPIAGSPRPSCPWIDAAFAARVGLADRLAPRPGPPARTLVQAEMHRVANSLSQAIGDELEDRAAAAYGIDQRHPFNDRRVAEFGFALPESQRWAAGETKVLIRRALGNRLPAPVRRRNDKAEFSPTLVETIEGLGGRAFLADLAVADAGWVDRSAAVRAYDEMTSLYRRGDAAYIAVADAVWSIASVELWLRVQPKERVP